MALVLTEEQSMLRDGARNFLRKNAPVSHLRRLRDSRDATGFSRGLWSEFVNMGWPGILVPADYGGLGLGHVETGVIMEELGHTLAPSPMFSTAIVAASAIARGASDAHKRVYLPKIAAGEIIATLAIDETTKHRPAQIAMTASRTTGGFTLKGRKVFVVDGHVADLFIVAARTAGASGDQKGISLFAFDAKSKGIGIERTVMVDSHNAARVTFDNVGIDAGALIGDLDNGWGVLDAALDAGRAALASEMLGAADEVFEHTVAYLRERKQFGKVIGQFQALQHRAANLYCELEVARSAILRGSQALDETPDRAAAIVSIAKAKAGSTATLAVQEGVQMHGGIGMTDEFDMGFFMKRVRVTNELFGDSSFHADRLARMNRY